MFSEALEQAQAGATLVTAGRRLARTLRESFSALQVEAGRRAWEAPAILPWPAWISELWDLLLFSNSPAPVPLRLDERQEAAVWECVIEAWPGADGLLDAAQTAQAALKTWALMRAWRLDAAVLEAGATDDALAFLGWARQFESRCAREGWIDAARATDYLAARLAGLPLPERIVLAGFDEITPQQREFLDACRAAGIQVSMAASPVCDEPRAVRAAFPDSSAEIAAAARWARSKLEEGVGEIGVVIRNNEERREEVERTFSQVLDPGGVRRPLFSLSAGPALASYPLVRAALRALDLAPEKNDFDGVSRLLRSPFLGAAEKEWTQRGSLDATLRRGANRVSIGRIERLAVKRGCPELAALLAAWRRERESAAEEQSPPEWARTFSSLLGRLGWPGSAPLGSAGYQTVEAWRDLLSDFAKMGAVVPSMRYGEAVARLRRIAEARIFQPESEAAPIRILSPLETFGLGFDSLWIAGLDDEHWPGPPQPAAFLPPALQRAYGLPRTSPERELAFAQMVTTRLLASAPEVVVSYARREGDCEFGPSPLIASVPEEELELPEFPLVRDAMGRPAPEKIEDSTGPPHVAETAPGGAKVFQDQAQCPFRAFAELRLGARALDTPAPGLSLMERGTLAHRAMEVVWRALGSHARLCSSTEAEVGEMVRAAVGDALAALEERRAEALPPRFAELEAGRLRRLLRAWLEVERQRAPFTVVAFEQKRSAEAGGVRCEVRVDRVDRLEDGRDVIIDYKTGQPTIGSWAGDRPDEPQAPLYAVSHQGEVAAVLFAQLRTGDSSFKGYAAEAGLVPGAKVRDLAADIEEWRRVLDRLGADFRAGVANVNPKKPATCRHCDLLALCRFSECEAPAGAFETEDGDA